MLFIYLFVKLEQNISKERCFQCLHTNFVLNNFAIIRDFHCNPIFKRREYGYKPKGKELTGLNLKMSST